MKNKKAHVDTALVRKLIAAQFPKWIDLPVKPVAQSGWDNKTFHLGDSMSIRLPSAKMYAPQVEKEHFWLPKLALYLSLPIPHPLEMVTPNLEYPYHWSIYQWIDGEVASIEGIADLHQFATSLAEFLSSLQKIDATDGLLAGEHNFYRGGLLTTYDKETCQAIASLDNEEEARLATKVWKKALSTTWKKTPVWVHGDVAVGNLLIEEGKLKAVIDFGSMGVGDPACDLVIAWTLFNGESRKTFKQTLSLDNATWERARSWALWKALSAAFPGTNRLDRRVIKEIFEDYENSNE